MSRLFGEISTRRSGEKQPDESEEDIRKPTQPPPEPARSTPAPKAHATCGSPSEAGLRHQIELLRMNLDRLKTINHNRHRVMQEREGRARAQVDELEASRQRIAILEDRQRQFAEKIRLTEPELRNARQDAKDSKEALEYERLLRVADTRRLTDLEDELESERTQRAALEQAKAELTVRLAELQRESKARKQPPEIELG